MFWRKQRDKGVEKDERVYGQLYDTKVRLASYWHQIDETRQAEPRNVLEIGVGSGFVSRYLDNYYHLTTLDISLDVFPKCIGSVLNLPFKDKTFDVTLCCQVLEHLPFLSFRSALDEVKRVTSKRVVLSLPDKNRFIPIQLPRIGRIKLPVPFKRPVKHVFDGDHHWEVNAVGSELGKVLQVIRESGFRIVRTYQVFENYRHRFFLLENGIMMNKSDCEVGTAKKWCSKLRNELKATIKRPSRCLSLTKKEKALKYFSSMRYQSHKTGPGHEEQSAWLNWNCFDNMEKAWRVNHRSHFVIIEWLKREMGGNPFSMLDCGILSGVTYRKLREGNLTVRYTGIDIAPQIVANCRKRYPEADWRVMDVQQLTLPSNSHDVVLIRHVLEHLPYYDKAIKEAKRVSKKHALFCLFFPLGDGDELREKSKKGGKYHFNTYGRLGFERLLKEEFSEIQEFYIADPQRDNQLFICKI